MRKVAINQCYGGFGLSDEACEFIAQKYPDLQVKTIEGLRAMRFDQACVYRIEDTRPENHPITAEHFHRIGIHWGSNFGDHSLRMHPALIDALETIGVEKCSGMSAQLALVDEPSGVWFIDEYDGWEGITALTTCERCGQPLSAEGLCSNGCGAPRDSIQKEWS